MHMSPDRRGAPAQQRRARNRGFTLIELLVTMTIFGIALAAAVPSFSTWVRNSRIRTVAQSLQDGLRLAQAEAQRRNRQTVFSLTNAAPGLNSTAATNGSNWAVHTVPLVGGENNEFLQGGSLGDMTGSLSIAGPAALCFNSAGRQTANALTGVSGARCVIDASTPLVAYDVTAASSSSGSSRPLRITVSLAGQVRLCDPARSLSTAADGCPP